MKAKPKISVITASKNGGRFLRETLDSILHQSFTDYEHVFVDSISTDNTLSILEEYKRKGYKHIRWISEPDRHADEGFYKAMTMSYGEYIMFCCVSDGYLDKNWFQKCVDVLDNNPDVSLVYGLPQNIKEDGSIKKVVFSNFLQQLPPQKQHFLPFWLGTSFVFPEITFCVRTNIFKECYPKFDTTGHFLHNHGLFSFNYNFNVNGYLPYFLPVVASFGRSHHDNVSNVQTEQNKLMKKQYLSAIEDYCNEVLSGKREHFFRDGESNVIGKVSSDDLAGYRKKVLCYRLNSRFYLGKRKKRSFGHQIKKLKIIINYYLSKN